ncbi:Nucleoporin NDC1 [Geodia barretti]|uniref:Nucleoporin NDC1 n=1 Tax=Geodia barretti TaxID=519541 RepID=A0AA35WEF1_GEOBA|nr:Nucleoporin NDC1 [Geodia barretti]
MRSVCDSVYRWRSGAAIVWTCVLSCPALVLYQLLALCNPLHPFTWIQDWLSSVLSARSFVFSCLYLLTLSNTLVIYSTTCAVVLPVYKTRLSVIWGVLRPLRLLVVASYALLGGGASYCLAELAGYHYLWSPHQSCRYCLNEYLFFHAAHGAFIGLRYGVRYYLLKESFMVFPSIQQHKLFRLRGHVTSHVREALTRTLGGLRYFYPLYFLLGYYPRNRVIRLLGLQLRDDVRLTSLSSLMDLGLFTSLLVAGTTIHVGWSFGLRIFRTFQTQVYRVCVTGN